MRSHNKKEIIVAGYTRERGVCLSWHMLPTKAMARTFAATTSFFIPT